MPSPLELFRAWEQSGRAALHVLQIDRGDGSAAHRVTLTDRPYYDKGVAGSKYHDTYPAPVHAIISEIVTDEQMSGTRFEPLRISNASGVFDNLDLPPLIFNRPFVLLRGDPTWSLMETDLPYRFFEIAHGVVEDVEFDKGRNEAILHIVPVKYRHERLIGEANKPIGFGYCGNVPATLEDSATNRWRFNSVWTSSHTTYFKPRDGGVNLVHTTDFTLVNEGGEFRGLIELTGGSPAFQLTCDLNYDLQGSGSNDEGIVRITRRFVTDHFVEDYNLPSSTLNVSGKGGSMVFLFTTVSKLFAYDGITGMHQYTLANPLSGAIDNSKSFDPGSFYGGAWATDDGSYVYTIDQNGDIELYSATPNDISTASLVSEFATVSLGASGGFSGICMSDDEATMYLLSGAGVIYEIAIPTPRTLSGLSVVNTFDTGFVASAIPGRLYRSDDLRYLYVATGTGALVQYELATPGSLAEVIDARREFVLPFIGAGNSLLFPLPCITRDGTRVLAVVNQTGMLYQFDMPEPWMLPRRVFLGRNLRAYSGGAFYQGEVAAGQVLSDLLANVDGEYSISRFGEVVASNLVDPDGFEVGAAFQLAIPDFLGERHSHVVQVNRHAPVQRVTVTYQKNYTQQTREQLAGSVSDDDVQEFANPHVAASAASALDMGQSPREILVHTGLNDQGGELADELIELWQLPRAEYDLRVALRSIPLLDDFGIGSLIKVGDWNSRLLQPERYVVITGTPAGCSSDVAASGALISDGFTIVGKFLIPDLEPAAQVMLTGDWQSAPGLQYALMIEAGGYLSVSTSSNGTAEAKTTMSVTLASFGLDFVRPVWLKVVFAGNDGGERRATFYYAFATGSDVPDDDDFLQMESVTGSATTIIAFPLYPRVGGHYGAPPTLAGLRAYRCILIGEDGATVLSDFDPRAWESGTGFESPYETWNISDVSGVKFHDAQLLVTGRRINWTKNEQVITGFR